MAVIRVKLIGSGTRDDSYRSGLPTAQMLLADYDEKTALVAIPDEDLHDEPAKIDPNGHKTSRGHQILSLDAAGHKAWHAHLDERYQERKGEFRPEVVSE